MAADLDVNSPEYVQAKRNFRDFLDQDVRSQ
jgi:hypothetical protein